MQLAIPRRVCEVRDERQKRGSAVAGSVPECTLRYNGSESVVLLEVHEELDGERV